MKKLITQADKPRIKRWLNCEQVSIDGDGDIWVEGPMTGHWLSHEKRDEFVAWRDAQKPGRKPKMTGGKRVNLYLDSASLALAAEMGCGNISEGIRIALQRTTGNPR